ncbi:hypothetical protein SDC9_196642 [bioreactor metagenome]|uniref:Zinc finger Ogr/Delta-type domain-containing protein n=1 Tax=bioreactor metagenome TaxID=1076179 RepID=A0A645IEY0_9ZZZZ|nr:ogr/Delta-like zinc finger family protein [Victivallaceae bacterium]
MKILCPHCRSKAIITHRKELSDKITEFYAECTSAECAARFVARVYYSHDITPPVGVLTNSLFEQAANLPEREKAELLRIIAPRMQQKLF